MKWYTFLIAIALLFVQCGGDDDGDGPTTRNENFGRVTMKIDGKQIVMQAYHPAYYGSIANEIEEYVRIDAANCGELIETGIMLVPQIGANDILKGLFITERIGVECPGQDYKVGKSYSIEGTCNITELGDRIKGTFEFTAWNPNDDTTYTITDGSFDIEVEQ